MGVRDQAAALLTAANGQVAEAGAAACARPHPRAGTTAVHGACACAEPSHTAGVERMRAAARRGRRTRACLARAPLRWGQCAAWGSGHCAAPKMCPPCACYAHARVPSRSADCVSCALPAAPSRSCARCATAAAARSRTHAGRSSGRLRGAQRPPAAGSSGGTACWRAWRRPWFWLARPWARWRAGGGAGGGACSRRSRRTRSSRARCAAPNLGPSPPAHRQAAVQLTE
jgi:hypothetical protein